MRYQYDFEFIEDGKTIDPISIGIVAEDGREYYAINEEADLSTASVWVRDNVIAKLEHDQPELWKTKYQIRAEMTEFFAPDKQHVELWAYYGAYDHVALCQFWGTMMDLPSGMPFYTLDIKQYAKLVGAPSPLPAQTTPEHHALNDARWQVQAFNYVHAYARRMGWGVLK